MWLLRRVRGRYFPAKPPEEDPDVRTKLVVRAMFAELKRTSIAQSSTLMLVLLPTVFDLESLNPWNSYAHEAAEEEGIPIIDVIPVFRGRSDARDLFLSEGFAAGHYNNAGHAVVSTVVADAIKAVSGR